jgi:hypothetical protein
VGITLNLSGGLFTEICRFALPPRDSGLVKNKRSCLFRDVVRRIQPSFRLPWYLVTYPRRLY